MILKETSFPYFKPLIRNVLAQCYRISWSGLFRLVLGKSWVVKHQKIRGFEKVHHLLDHRIRSCYVRRFGDMAQVKLPDGVILVPFEALFIVGEIYWDRIYDRLFRLEKNDVVIDVGAHFGVFTLKAAKRAGMVLAIEPIHSIINSWSGTYP